MSVHVSIAKLRRLFEEFSAPSPVRQIGEAVYAACDGRLWLLAPASEFDEVLCRSLFPKVVEGRKIMLVSASGLPEIDSMQQNHDEYTAQCLGGEPELINDAFHFLLHDLDSLDAIDAACPTGAIAGPLSRELCKSYPNLEDLESECHPMSYRVGLAVEAVFLDMLYGLVGKKTEMDRPTEALEFLLRFAPIAFVGDTVVFLAR